MVICLVTTGYPPDDGGGIGIYTKNLAEGLQAKGHEVIVIAQGSYDTQYELRNVKIFRYRVRGIPILERFFPGLRWSYFVSGKINELYKKYHFSLIEFPNWEGVGICSLMFSKNIPIVTRLHTTNFETMKYDFSGQKASLSDKFINLMEKYAVVKSKFIVSSAEYHRQLISQEYHFDPSRVTNIPLGVLPPLNSSKIKKDAGKIRIICVGRLEHRKGTLCLLNVIPEIVQKYNNVEFYFIGNDRKHAPGKITFEEYFKDQHKEYINAVKFIGYIEFDDIKKYYCESDIFVLPSLCENFGLVYAEAMMYGLPVIGCNTTAVPEVVLHEKTGLLIEPNNQQELKDAIIRLVSDKELRENLGKQARIHAEKEFHVATMITRTEKYFKEIAGVERA